MMSLVNHMALDKNEFRLLRINSIANTLITCTLEHTLLGDAGEYHALSYCWGDEVASRNITVDDEKVNITPTLFAGLAAVYRYFDEANVSDRRIWIDAVCINQRDNEEKSSQVGSMGNIYRDAKRVLIWLGEHEPQSKGANQCELIINVLRWVQAAFILHDGAERLNTPHDLDPMLRCRLLREESKAKSVQLAAESQLRDDHRIMPIELRAFTGMLSSFISPAILNSKTLTAPEVENQVKDFVASSPYREYLFSDCHPFWNAFWRMMHRPWFSRVWTVQELVLSRSAFILYGESSVNWDVVERCRLTLLHPNCGGVVYSYKSTIADDGITLAFSESPGLLVRTSPGRKKFATLLSEIITRRATDPRDYIYGILGLVEDDIRTMIGIDYRLSISAVFVKAVRIACQYCQNPWILIKLLEVYQASTEFSIEGHPSWCPDFSKSRIQRELPSPFDRRYRISQSIIDATDCSFSVMFEEDATIAHVRGTQLDTIGRISKTKANSFSPDLSSQSYFEFICNEHHRKWLIEMAALFHCDPDGDLQALDSWLDVFFFARSSVQREEQRHIFHELCSFSEQMYAHNVKAATDLSKLNVALERMHQLLSTLSLALVACEEKYFFVTTSGNVGFSPTKVQPREVICYIPGGAVLHVLTPRCDRHVGWAYVKELMGDTLESLINKKDCEWETFRLE